MVVGTLMNICDNPTRISIGQGWMENDVTRRIPIIVTGGCHGWGWGRARVAHCAGRWACLPIPPHERRAWDPRVDG